MDFVVRRTRRSDIELDSLAREVARVRLTVDSLTGTHPALANIVRVAAQRGLDVRDTRDAHILYDRAIRDGLVRIDVQDSRRQAARSQENATLGRELTEAVHHGPRPAIPWFEARVVEVTYPTAGAEVIDNSVHEQLGWHAGGVWLASELAPGDRVAVAAGRAAVWTINGLIKTRGLAGLGLYALSGGSERGVGAVMGRSLDADSVVRHAVASCDHPDEGPDKVRYTTLPLALPAHLLKRGSPDGLLRLVAGHLLDDWFEKRRPEVAVLGFGSMTSARTHPLFLTQNKFVRDTITELQHVLHTHEHDGLEVAEIAHHLWVASTPTTPGYAAAERIVTTLNQILVAPTLTGLRHARKRLIVAGGESKTTGLHALLTSDIFKHRPTTLFTDTTTAQHLLTRLTQPPPQTSHALTGVQAC